MAVQYASDNYYREERQRFGDVYDIEIPNDDVIWMIRRIATQWKIKLTPASTLLNVRFYGHNDSGSASRWRGMRLSNYPSLGLILHEMAHMLLNTPQMRASLTNLANTGTDHHGLRFQSALFQMVTRARERKTDWAASLDNRKAKRKVKSDELIAKNAEEQLKLTCPVARGDAKLAESNRQLLKRQDDLARYEKRLTYFNKLYGNKIKKAKRSIGALERSIGRQTEA